MARGSGIIRKVSGKVGDLVYQVRGGQQVIRGVATTMKNPRTELQMLQRMKWPNVLAVYRALQPYMKDCFETKQGGQTDYNRFMGINLHAEPVYLEKGAARLGAAIVAPYVLSQGSLPSVQVNGATPATDIALGTLTIDDDTTVAELAQAVVQNNYAYSYGDQIAFFRLVQEEDSQDGHPYISVSATRVNLDPTDTGTLRSVAPASGFSTVSGMLGADAALTGAGIAWVHSRTTNGKTHVSSQRLVVENDLLEEYGTTQMLSVATKSYGGTTEIFIRPDGSSGGVIVDGNEDGGSSPSEPGSGDEDSFG